MIWITGDKHGDFSEVKAFCRVNRTQPEDLLIVLGDAGINYYRDERAAEIASEVSRLPITLFCVHGNHEARPETREGYELREGYGGRIYVNPRYPNIHFPVDGEIYTIGNQRIAVIGGAYSVDKFYRLRNRWSWFEDEQPSDEIKARFEAALNRVGWQVDAVLSHTCPESVVPRKKLPPLADDFLPVDTSTEAWLETVRKRLTFRKWYAGHFHIEHTDGPFHFLYHNFIPFGIQHTGTP